MGSRVMGVLQVLVALLLFVGISPRSIKEDQHSSLSIQGPRIGRQGSEAAARRGAVNYKAFIEGKKDKGDRVEVKEEKDEGRGEVGSTYLLYEILRADGSVLYVPIIPPGRTP